jgi:hypothetical protein
MDLPTLVHATFFDTYVITACLFALMTELLTGLFRKTWNGFPLVVIFAVLFFVIPILTIIYQLNFGNLAVIRSYNDLLLCPDRGCFFLDQTNVEYAGHMLWRDFSQFFNSSLIDVLVGLVTVR